MNQNGWIIDAITASRLAVEAALRDEQTEGNILVKMRSGGCDSCPSLLVGMAQLERRQFLSGERALPARGVIYRSVAVRFFLGCQHGRRKTYGKLFREDKTRRVTALG